MDIQIMARKNDLGESRIRLQQEERHWADVARDWTGEDVALDETES
jgi:hypothetical protein